MSSGRRVVSLFVIATAACGSRTDLEALASPPHDGGAGTNAGDTGVRDVACLLLGAAIAEVDGGTGATWLWNGGGWAHDPAVGPPTRENAAIAGLGGKVVVFGGASSGTFGGGNLDDTWVWDGAGWTEPHVQAAPSARANAAFAAQGNGAVLFGGQGLGAGGAGLDDTWVWDGTEWTQRFPAHSPSARYAAAAAAVGSAVLLFGGFTGPHTLVDETWQWDGTDWTKIVPPSSPVARAGAMAATFGDGAVLFGGLTGAGLTSDCVGSVCFFSDTWVWDGSTWTAAAISGGSPPARAFGSAGTLRTSFVVFGGESPTPGNMGSPELSDTWTWDGSTWTEWLKPGPSGLGASGALGCY
jgi:hypothetical protein